MKDIVKAINQDKNTKTSVQAVIVIVGLILVMFFAWKVLGVIEARVYEVDASIYTENTEVNYTIESVSWSETGVMISGWCLVPEEDIKYAEMHLLIESNGVYYQVPTMLIERKNVTDLYDDGYNYDYSGFYSLIDFQNFKIEENQDFNMYMIYNSNGREDIINLNTTLRGWGQ